MNGSRTGRVRLSLFPGMGVAMVKPTADRKPRVAVAYHFFAHYRSAVLTELLADPAHDYILAGDLKSTVEPTIKHWLPQDMKRYVAAPCRMIGPIMWQSGLIRLALRSDLDAIVYLGNAAWPATWLSAILARLTGKRVFFWTHGWIRRETGAKAIFRNTFYRLAHGLLLYGHMAKMIGLASGFSPHRLHVIYNSLDYVQQKQQRDMIHDSQLDELRRSLFREQCPIIVCTTRLIPVRRLDLLLQAVKRLADQGQACNLLLVGDGPELAKLQALAKELALDVCFYGACYDEAKLSQLMMASNVTVAPGKVGLTAMHSLAYGTPVVTHGDADHQMPEWEAITPGITGGFFLRDDVDSLAQAIKPWLGQVGTSPATRQACFRIIERFYHPAFQKRTVNRAVDGQPADDLYWLKPG